MRPAVARKCSHRIYLSVFLGDLVPDELERPPARVGVKLQVFIVRELEGGVQSRGVWGETDSESERDNTARVDQEPCSGK